MKKLIKILAGIVFFFLILSLTLYLATSGDYDVTQTIERDKSLPVIKAGDRIFHGETFGSKNSQPVIVLHGGPGGDYRNLLPLKALADRYYVIFYDQSGSGLSPRQDSGSITLESTLKDLDLIVEAYRGGRPVYIIGHSWGAMLGTAYTGRHPEKVSRLLLAEPGFLTPEKAMEFIYKTRPPMTTGALWFLIRTWFESLHISSDSYHDRYDYIMERMITGFDSPDHPLSGYYCNGKPPAATRTFWRFGFGAWEDILNSGMDDQGNYNVSFTEGIDRFQKKVLFLTGECNQLIGKEYQEEQMVFFPKKEIIVIPGAGHLMFAEKPRESLKVVRKYFSGAL